MLADCKHILTLIEVVDDDL